ncbi:acyl-CoA dehydrogenase family protein [Streptomyces anulatus]|uniref:acyl-CoA dehydrogenase family protein n=1 Tax=Streptomyces anulatus TaxID=1892 RepID=UPI003244407C
MLLAVPDTFDPVPAARALNALADRHPALRTRLRTEVPVDAPGASLDDRVEQMGVRAAATSDVIFDRTPVRTAQRIGPPGGGRTVALSGLGLGRLGIAAQMVGLAQGALDAAIGYSRVREQFGGRIADHQGVAFPLADVASRLAAGRALLYRAVDLHGRARTRSS